MNLEQLTFRGSGLDRAAHLRGKSDEIDTLFASSQDCIVFWRGKVLVDQTEHRLVRVPSDHLALKACEMSPVFMGMEPEPVFAVDVSSWQPDNDPVDQSFLDESTQQHPDFPKTSAFVDIRSNLTLLSARDGELAATARSILEWHRSHAFCSKCGTKSDMAQAGWQRNCPSCEASHFPRTDPVVIMLITRGNSVLIGRSPFWPEGMYSLLAGFIEPGETIEDAVRREVFEETQIKVGHVSYLTSQPWPFPSSLMIGCAGDALTSDITIDPVEIEDAQWVTKEDMLDIMSGEHPNIQGARKGSIAHFLMENWLADTLDTGQND